MEGDCNSFSKQRETVMRNISSDNRYADEKKNLQRFARFYIYKSGNICKQHCCRLFLIVLPLCLKILKIWKSIIDASRAEVFLQMLLWKFWHKRHKWHKEKEENMSPHVTGWSRGACKRCRCQSSWFIKEEVGKPERRDEGRELAPL